MLRLSREEDMPLVRDLILDGARAGSFDPALAEPTSEAAYFFSGMRRVVLEHVWLRPASGTETQVAIPAAIWVYEERQVSPRALGFIALRGAGHLGYELWLIAIHPEYRNRGLGKRMISEILATPIGQRIMVAQCDLHAIGARRLARILCEAGFQSARTGKASEWLANPALTPSAMAWLKATPFQNAFRMN